MAAIPTPHAGRAGLGAVDQILALPDLVDLFLERNHFEFAQAADQFELLHVESPETCVVEPFGHYAKRVAHEDLVHLVTGKEVRGGQLNVVLGFCGRDGENVIFGINHEVMCIEHWQGERVEPEEPKQGPFGDHGHVDEEMSILTIEEQRRLHLKQIRVILDQQFASGFVGSFQQLLEEVDQLSRVQVVDGESLVHGCLNSVSDSSQLSSKLVFQTRQSGVE